jgi:hypothetical protein
MAAGHEKPLEKAEVKTVAKKFEKYESAVLTVFVGSFVVTDGFY